MEDIRIWFLRKRLKITDVASKKKKPICLSDIFKLLSKNKDKNMREKQRQWEIKKKKKKAREKSLYTFRTCKYIFLLCLDHRAFMHKIKVSKSKQVLLTHPALEIGTVLFMVSKYVHLDSNTKQTWSSHFNESKLYIYIYVYLSVCVCDLKKKLRNKNKCFLLRQIILRRKNFKKYFTSYTYQDQSLK